MIQHEPVWLPAAVRFTCVYATIRDNARQGVRVLESATELTLNSIRGNTSHGVLIGRDLFLLPAFVATNGNGAALILGLQRNQ